MGNLTKREKNVSSLLRVLFSTFYDKTSEKVVDFPLKSDSPILKNRESEDMGKRLLRVLIRTNYFNSYTFDYLKDSKNTYKSLAMKYKVNFNTVRSSIWYYLNKFEKQVSRDDLEHLVSGNRYTYYSVENFVQSYENRASEMVILDSLSCELPRRNAVASLTQDEINEALDKIEVCTKSYAKRVMNSLTDEQLGYIWYLLQYGSILTERDNMNLGRLKTIALADRNGGIENGED